MEPYESRDIELGQVLRSWADTRAGSLKAELAGPFDAHGMDATWLLRLSGPLLDAEVVLLYGPMVDISMYMPHRLDDGAFVGGGGEEITPERLAEMLDDLGELGRGGTVPAWLRPETGP